MDALKKLLDRKLDAAVLFGRAVLGGTGNNRVVDRALTKIGTQAREVEILTNQTRLADPTARLLVEEAKSAATTVSNALGRKVVPEKRKQYRLFIISQYDEMMSKLDAGLALVG